MDENGKMCDTLVEREVFTDQKTGLPMRCTSLVVWADAGLRDTIAAIPGVRDVIVHSWSPTAYHTYIDHRYDAEYVGKMIEEALG